MTQAEALALPFPKALVKHTQGRDYIEVHEVIVRLNLVLGVGGWSSNIHCEMHGDWVIAKCQLIAHVDGEVCTATQYGGHKQQTDKNDLGDTFKSASSDALKKAAQQLGLGLYLARSDDAKRLVPQRTAAVDHGGSDTGGAGGIESVPSQGDTRQQPPATIGAVRQQLENAGLNAEPA